MKAFKLASVAAAALLSLSLMACGENSSLEIASLTDSSKSGVEITAVNSSDEETSEGVIIVKENDTLVFDAMGDQTGRGTIHVTLTAPGGDKPAIDKDVTFSSWTSDVVEAGTYDLAIKCDNASGTLKIYAQNADELNKQNQQLVDDAIKDTGVDLEKVTDGDAADANAASNEANKN